jgi:hypothetical protein
MSIIIDLTDLDGKELEQAKVRAEEVIAQFVCKDCPNDVPVSIITGDVALTTVHYITIDTTDKTIVFKDAFERDIAYMSLTTLRFKISKEEASYRIVEV